MSALAVLAVAASILAPATAHATATAGPGVSSTSAHAAASSALSKDQAIAQAHGTGKPVQVTSATTASSTLTANPNGTLTLAQSAAPVRKKIDGAWQNLDATLVKTAHGYAPRISTDALTLSPGGTGPIATLGAGSSSLTLSLPKAFTLSAPTVSGASATYANVLPGVDLEVTANPQGGFGETLIVNNAAAARNPALASIAFTTGSKGLSLHADKAGNLTATDPNGAILYTAPAPSMWDSTASRTASAGQLDAKTGAPTASTAHIPGAAARTARVHAAVSGDTLTLTPDKSLLTGAATHYPEYIDPTYTPSTAVSSGGAYAYTSSFTGSCNGSSDLADVAYYDDSSDYLRTGYSDTDCDVANYHTFLQIPVGGIAKSVVSSVTLGIYNSYSGSCTAETTDLYQTGLISSQTTWNNEPTWNSTLLAAASYANGYSSSCNSGGAYVGFNGNALTNLVQTAANASWSNITFGLKAATANVSYSIRHYTDSATLTITYDYTPTIAAVTGNPVNLCENSAALAQAHPVGLGDAVFEAKVDQTLGTNLTAMFYLYNASGTELNPTVTSGSATTSSPTTTSVTAGQYTALRAHETFFTTALGLTSAATFHWYVKATDVTLTSSPSKTCYFTYDPTVPGNPTITSEKDVVSGGYCPSIEEEADGATTTTCIIGTTTKYQFTDTSNNGAVVGSYRYQLNGAAPINVAPTASTSPYTALITLKPSRGTDVLTVTAVSSAGNVGGNATIIFTAKAPTGSDAVAGDMSGNGVPDLLTVGSGTSTPAGLWEANGQASGPVEAATDIGYQGDATGCTASAFTGDQAISGDFYDTGMQGALAYNPTTKAGAVFSGTGDGSAFQTASTCGTNASTDPQLESDITINELYDQYYYTNYVISGAGQVYDTPLQIANAYHAYSGDSTAFDDLIGTNYDAKVGAYFLTYFENNDSAAGWGTTLTILASSTDNGLTPAGGTDWNNWKIATTSIGSALDMFLWDTSTGDLYLWQNVTVTSNGDGTGKLAYANHYLIKPGWSTASTQTFEAADITGKGIPDIWTVDASGNVTTTLLSSIKASPTLTTVASSLGTATHNWALNDFATTAGDNTSGSALSLDTSGSKVIKNSGDMFDPDVDFEGSGDLYSVNSSGTKTNALDLTGSITVSGWAKPGAGGCMVMSQDGTSATSYPGMYLTDAAGAWKFYLAKDNGAASWDGDTITGGTAEPGTWTHLQATYDITTKVMSLYVDDTLVAAGSHAAPGSGAGATGAFRLGSNIDNGAQTNFCTGQIALAQTWNAALAPNQPTTQAGYHQSIVPERILDTRLNVSTGNPDSGATENDTPVGANSTITVPIDGDTVTQYDSGTTSTATIPTTATAVAVDVTVTDNTAAGTITAYADQSQRPMTSSTNYTTSADATGYQIVPIGPDGKIALYNSSTGTTHVIVDITGYFTSNAALAGDQTYTPLTTAQRIFDTRSNVANTSRTSTGAIPAGTTFTVNIDGVDGIASNATAVAINLTALNETTGGYLEAYPTGAAPAADTSLTYSTGAVASMSADIPVAANGTITIDNVSASTNIIGDVSGYYTSSTSGEVYHSVNPTRLVDTRIGIGGQTVPVSIDGYYHLADASQITSNANPTLALMVTVTNATANGDYIVYPLGGTQPTTSNLNWDTADTRANLALAPEGTSGEVDFYSASSGTNNLVVDCSGYFATS